MIARTTSAGDPRLAPYRLVAKPDELLREGLFVAEGRLVLPELLASPYTTVSVLVSEAALEGLQPLLSSHPRLDVLVAPADLISEAGGHDFHRGCLALGRRDAPPAPAFDSGRPIVVLDRVSNPDNVGVIFRTALGFGAAGVILGPGCADPLYRKAIRTSMGATLRVPWHIATGWPEELRHVRDRGYALIALTPRADAAVLRNVIARITSPIALLLGSEGYGLPDEILAIADYTARIPIASGVDSLNVATAASIALYEAGLRA